jgi:hypothetical protein
MGEIVSAPRRNDQDRQSQFDELPQMAVDCPIPTKQQNNIDLSPVRGHAHAPLDRFVSLKRSKMFRRASQPENGGSPHVPMRVAESDGRTATLTRNLPTKRYRQLRC